MIGSMTDTGERLSPELLNTCRFPTAPAGACYAALEYADRRHRGQLWKQRPHLPFIRHLIEVANLLWETAVARETELLAAAILHDVIEKTGATAAEVEAGFGKQVCTIVLELTDPEGLPRKERYRLQLEQADTLSLPARRIKIADKISNVRDLGDNPPPHWPPDRQREYLQWAAQVVERLRGSDPALEAEFDRCLETCRAKLRC